MDLLSLVRKLNVLLMDDGADLFSYRFDGEIEEIFYLNIKVFSSGDYSGEFSESGVINYIFKAFSGLTKIFINNKKILKQTYSCIEPE